MAGDYLTSAEAAALLRIGTSRLRALRHDGVFVEGTHYTRPQGLGIRWLRDGLDGYVRGLITADHFQALSQPARRRSKVNPELRPR